MRNFIYSCLNSYCMTILIDIIFGVYKYFNVTKYVQLCVKGLRALVKCSCLAFIIEHNGIL